MFKDAINKLNQEISQTLENPYVKCIGEYLVDYISSNHQHAENIMQEDKTIIASLKYMESKASEKASGRMAMFTPEEGFKIVLDYYGIDESVVLKAIGHARKINITLDDLL